MSPQKPHPARPVQKRHRWKLLRRAPNEYRCLDCGFITLENERVPPCPGPSTQKDTP